MSLHIGLLRALHSRNPKNIRNPLIFLEKWLLTHVFAGFKVKNPCASKLASVLDFETLVCKVFREKMEKLFGYTADHAMFSGNECDLADDPLV